MPLASKRQSPPFERDLAYERRSSVRVDEGRASVSRARAGDKTIFVTEVAKHFDGAKNILCTAGDAAHDDETTP
jgi:hypothetical protein